jgi:serine/threonine-protein kinase SRPK3
LPHARSPIPAPPIHAGTKPARSPSPSPSRSASASSSGGASASATDTSDADAEDAADYRRGGYHPVRIGERFKNGRYAVLRKLGWGHFSTVWLVSDAEAPPGDAHAGLGALKVVKSAAHYAEAARDEVQILARVAARDPGDGRHCCRLRDSFEHAGPHGRHVCMVFEVLGDNLLALIRAYAHRGVPLPAVRRLARQVLVALDFLHRECGVIHTDLKPENVMLREPLRPPPAGGGGGLEGAAAASGGGGGPVLGGGAPGKLAAVAEAGGRLSKAQRNRLKKRAAAKAAGGKGGEGSGGAGGDEEMGEGSSRGASPSAPPPAPAGGPLAASVSLDAMSLEEGAAAAAADAALAAAAPAPAPAPAGRRPPLDLEALGARLGALDARVVDFGNACWADKHFTDDIQTRQYRAPEVRAWSCWAELGLGIWVRGRV